jgi:GTP-binding protein EngB required for normal cell division
VADLANAIQSLSAAVEAAAEMVPAEALEGVSAIARAAEQRHGFLGDTVVIALAGGTGSGKSSLLNALAGHEVSGVGAVRPTTAEPLVWLPANPEPGLVRLVDDLGIGRRVGHEHRLPVAVIDLPDYDSIEFEHRATVERLLPRVDAVIWVLDPQKYSDRALHRDYLVPLAGYAEQFLFVLNQVDRLDDAGRAAVLSDLTDRLVAEGFAAPRILTTAARPVVGEARGIDTLGDVIAERFEAKRTAHAKLLADLRRARRGLLDATRVGDEPLTEPREQWTIARDAAVAGLTDLVAGPAAADRTERVGERLAAAHASGPIGRAGAVLRRSRLGRAFGAAPDVVGAGEWWAQPGLERVLAGLSRAVTDISTGLGVGLGRRLRADLTPERLEQAVRSSVEGARHDAGELGPPAPKWWWRPAGIAQVVLFAALVAGAAWVWVDGVDRGEVPWNVIVIGASIGMAWVLGLATRASGRRAGRRRAGEFRSTVEQAIAAQVEVRIGADVDRALSVRDRMGAAMARLEADIGEVENQLESA